MCVCAAASCPFVLAALLLLEGEVNDLGPLQRTDEQRGGVVLPLREHLQIHMAWDPVDRSAVVPQGRGFMPAQGSRLFSVDRVYPCTISLPRR